MDGGSSRASGHCQECQPALPNAASGDKRLPDSAEPVQAPQSPKKTCVLSLPCSSTGSPGKLLLSSPGSGCFEGFFHSLGDSGCGGRVVGSSTPKCHGDAAVSLETSGCFDDSEPGDSLLEPSDSEEDSFPFDYGEKEIQKILADDCMECEQDPTGTSALSQSGSGESEKHEGSSCTEASVTSGDASVASEVLGKPDEVVSRDSSPLCSECYPSLLSASAGAKENPRQAAPATCALFELDLQELLVLRPIDSDCEDEPLEDSCWEEAEGVASEATRSSCPEFDNTASSSVLEETSGGSEGQQSLGAGCLGKAHSASEDGDVSSSCGARVGSSMPRSGPACGQHAADGSSAPRLLGRPTPSSRSRQRGLCRERKGWLSRTLGSPEEREDSAEAEQSSDSIQLSDAGVSQEETTSGKKPGEVIPVPQEKRPTQRLEQKKHLYPEHEEGCGSYVE